MVVIVTDGYENASINFTNDQIASMIGGLEKTGKWTFSYLGATIDAVDVAQSLNINKNNAMQYNMSEISELYNKISFSMDLYLSEKQTGKIRKDFLEQDNHKDNNEE